jgi:AraC-like DNA-binding protein
MKLHFEKVEVGSRCLNVFERDDSAFAFHWHYHPEYELTFIVDSHGQRLVGDGIADYGPGDLVLLGPDLPHSWRSSPGKPGADARHRAIVVHFRQDFVGSEFLALEEMRPVARLLEASRAGLAFGATPTGIRTAARLRELPALSSPRRLLLVLSVLQELAEESGASVLSTERVRPVYRRKDQRRIETICSYLERHYCEPIDFSRLSRSVRLDRSSLCRFFKKATGRTITTYVNQLRIGAASNLLTNTDLSTLEIGLQVGFGNYSNFSRHFRQAKGCAPSKLRRQFMASGPNSTS